MKQNFRHELKHTINQSDAISLRQRLRAVAARDCHANEQGSYFIRSLYFDNVDNKVLREKIDGISRREKFRIRFYDYDDTFIRLEKKAKVNGRCFKESAPVTREECERLLAGDTGWLRLSSHPLLNELCMKMQSQQLRPQTIVDYTREAYVYPAGNTRVTFDSNIRTGIHCRGLFDREFPTMYASHPGQVILEIKYDAFLPDIIRDIVQLSNRQNTAFSKYAACRIYG
ncbi:VTC domain protein [[Clostridium] methylpentosum DSM 5476]|uniref:VTC domain protein n=1 Tax=[Clostridium] methylpentosum DSM 5476 TaxID=537013 RepID=C0EC44_9FIRM|nr:VTC domain protein [[Clostridium] methylpentosum DSM 5476]MDY3989593.1 polyphosphate polymerase domain-containing protein [Massilioclostridium sp.]MEE1491849.1 polyphosphate polymerase domain-containing protein [Massilioclostridium sp.]